MPTGNPQSTLLSELNRLANGGTYPPVNTMDEAAAARAWAGRTDIPLTTTDTVGVLNEIAGLPSDQWLDYSGVCNYLAGTTNLPAAAALRQIEGDVQSPTPSEPLLLFATPGNQSVFLNWAPPANEGDAPVDSYRVILAGQPGTVYQEGPGIGVTITGLTNGTTYSFQVQAHNSFGWGPLSLPSAGAVPAFEEYAAVQSGNTISFTSWREANAQPNNGYPGRYFYSDGTQLFQGQTAVVQGSSVPVAAAWGNSNLTVQPDGWYSPDTFSIPDMQSNTGFNYATSVNIVPNYTCPVGGFYNPATGMCVESYPATATTTWYSAFCASGAPLYAQNYETGICYLVSNPPADNWFPSDNVQVTNYSCPLGGTYNPATGMCE